MYIVPDQIILNILPFLLHKHSFLDPSYWFPALKFDQNFISIEGFDKIEKDLSLDGISCEIEGFVELNENRWHVVMNIRYLCQKI